MWVPYCHICKKRYIIVVLDKASKPCYSRSWITLGWQLEQQSSLAWVVLGLHFDNIVRFLKPKSRRQYLLVLFYNLFTTKSENYVSCNIFIHDIVRVLLHRFHRFIMMHTITPTIPYSPSQEFALCSYFCSKLEKSSNRLLSIKNNADIRIRRNFKLEVAATPPPGLRWNTESMVCPLLTLRASKSTKNMTEKWLSARSYSLVLHTQPACGGRFCLHPKDKRIAGGIKSYRGSCC
jgi:hypothetical protein